MATPKVSLSVTPPGERAAGRGPNVVRWTGAFGLAAIVVFLLATPLYFIGSLWLFVQSFRFL